MEKIHITPRDSAETFGTGYITDPFAESIRSKSMEHIQRFINNENSQKSEKIKDIES